MQQFDVDGARPSVGNPAVSSSQFSFVIWSSKPVCHVAVSAQFWSVPWSTKFAASSAEFIVAEAGISNISDMSKFAADTGSDSSVTCDGMKSSSENTSGFSGQRPVLLKPLTALCMLAVFTKAVPQTVHLADTLLFADGDFVASSGHILHCNWSSMAHTQSHRVAACGELYAVVDR